MICGGDGVCGLNFSKVEELVGEDFEWISVARKFGALYSVAGNNGKLKRKISIKEWPGITKNY